MNVVRIDPVKRTDGRGRGRGRVNSKPLSVLPKYQFDRGFRRPLVDLIPVSNVQRTPVTRRKQKDGTTGSSFMPVSSTWKGTSSTNVRISTPGSSSSACESHVIVAVTSGRGDSRTEVGIAAIDLQNPHMVLCEITDCQTYVNTLTKIYVLDPIEIIMPDTMCDSAMSKNNLYNTMLSKFPNLNIVPVSRIHFNDREGFDRIRKHCAKEYASVELFVKEKYYALAAVAALFKYIEYIQHILYSPKSMRIEFQGSHDSTVIDVESAIGLELVTSQFHKRSVYTLFGSLNFCTTPMGRRLLRASILQPPCKQNLIDERQACVSELVSNISLRAVLQGVVRKFYGADRLLDLASKPIDIDNVYNAERNLNYILLLKHSLDSIPELRTALVCGESITLKRIRINLENPEFQTMLEKILKIINPDARSVMGYNSANMQRCFAIKTGLNDLLDIARQTYCELIDDMKTMVESLSVKYKIPMALSCSASLGYHIEATMPKFRSLQVSDIPEEFIQVQKRKNTFYMTTIALMVRSQECKLACDELHTMSNVLLSDLLENIREHVGCLFQLSADVAELDLLLSLSEISCLPDRVKPIFSSRLSLKGSIHPIILFMYSKHPVANDVQASIVHNFHLITGPNMSGKSVYLKQIVLLQIMAQIGCYVPATSAEFRISDRIFCRVYSRDDIECNASMFTVDMKETQYILQSVTPRSLIILDEPCRATSVEEGTSIAWAICQQLMVMPAFIFCATHFDYMTRMIEIYHNVTNYCFETLTVQYEGSKRPRLLYTHKLKPGTNLLEKNGISLAEMSDIPESTIAKAWEFAAEDVESRMIATHQNMENELLWKKCYTLVANLYNCLEDDEFSLKNVLIVTRREDLDLAKLKQLSNKKQSTMEDQIEQSKLSELKESLERQKLGDKSENETNSSNSDSKLDKISLFSRNSSHKQPINDKFAYEKCKIQKHHSYNFESTTTSSKESDNVKCFSQLASIPSRLITIQSNLINDKALITTRHKKRSTNLFKGVSTSPLQRFKSSMSQKRMERNHCSNNSDNYASISNTGYCSGIERSFVIKDSSSPYFLNKTPQIEQYSQLKNSQDRLFAAPKCIRGLDMVSKEIVHSSENTTKRLRITSDEVLTKPLRKILVPLNNDKNYSQSSNTQFLNSTQNINILSDVENFRNSLKLTPLNSVNPNYFQNSSQVNMNKSFSPISSLSFTDKSEKQFTLNDSLHSDNANPVSNLSSMNLEIASLSPIPSGCFKKSFDLKIKSSNQPVSSTPLFKCKKNFPTKSTETQLEHSHFLTNNMSMNGYNEYLVNESFYNPSSSNSSFSLIMQHDDTNFNYTQELMEASINTTMARMTARQKETEIFRKIEGAAFKEEHIMNSTHKAPLFIDLVDDK